MGFWKRVLLNDWDDDNRDDIANFAVSGGRGQPTDWYTADPRLMGEYVYTSFPDGSVKRDGPYVSKTSTRDYDRR